MPSAARLLFLYAPLTVAGYLLATYATSRSSPVLPGPAAAAAPIRSAAVRPPAAAAAKTWTLTDFIALLTPPAGTDAYTSIYERAKAEVATWTDAELHHALDAYLASPDGYLHQFQGEPALQIILEEWMKRDLSAVTAWLDGIPSRAIRVRFSRMLLNSWPADRAEDGVRFLFAHPDGFAESGSPITGAALTLAARRGPQAVAELLAEFARHGLGNPNSEITFPPGFDFAALVASEPVTQLWQRHGASTIALAWMKQDPDAAFDAIVALNRENGAMPGEYLYLPESPTPERAVWLAGKLNDLTPNECSNLIQSQGLGMLGSSPEAALAFTRALTDPANRRQMADYAARSMPSIGVEAALPQLEFLGDPPARLAYLENFTSSFQRAIDSPGITPAGDQLLRTALQQWQATPQQIETIMTRVHAPPP